jgi:uncharacterized protein (DUF885 family)
MKKNAALAALAEEFWAKTLAWNPMNATALGERRYDDRMPSLTPESLALQRAALEEIAHKADGLADDRLAPDEQVTRLQLVAVCKDGIEERTTGLETWTLDPLEGPQVALFNVPAWTSLRTKQEADAYLLRVRAMGAYLGEHLDNLERGHAKGLSSAKGPAEKVLAQLETQLARPTAEWSLVAEPPASLPETMGEGARAELRDALEAAVDRAVRPAFEKLLTFVRETGVPRARPNERAGLCALDGGVETYARLVRVHTSLPLTAEAIHRTGLAEVAKIDDEMRALGAKALGTKDLSAIQERLRSDPALHFRTRDEVEAKAVEALRRAEAAMPRWFGRNPTTPCVVKRIEAHEEPFSTIAYYRQPATDGSRPGVYWINTSEPPTRPRYEAEALAFHEAVPGHHTQIALAQEMEDVPEFRKHTGPTSYVEGWALYTERLCDEMGLYSGDLDRIGMLSFDAWRACRLVVDTGIHAMGWSRGQAIEFMLAHSALAENNIANEVDRYISWPGQAVAYKTGQLEILRLRERAQASAGSSFDIRAFHDAVLGSGAVALPTLAAILGYVESAR